MIAYKLDQERHRTVIFHTNVATSSSLIRSVEQAGWRVSKDAAPRAAALILSDGAPTASTQAIQGQIGRDLAHVASGFDFVIDPAASLDDQVALLARWLPPSLDALVRMEQSFGRAALEPLLTGLAGELAAAVAAIDAGERPNAHKLAGVSGTFGFHDVGECWRVIDQGAGDLSNARRLSRTTIVAIRYWLDSSDSD